MKNFNRLDRPLSFRVPHSIHSGYKLLSEFHRNEIQYKFCIWIKKQIQKAKNQEKKIN